MDSMLIVVTAAAVALAASMGILVAKVVSDERRRSHARAALLADLASQAAAEDALADYELQDDVLPVAPDVASSDLFAAREAGSAWPRRLAIVGGIAVVLVAVTIGVRSLASFAPPPTTNATTSPAPQPGDDTPSRLELMSLTHAEEKGTLKITGLVQNPRGGDAVSKVSATAFLFGADGTFLASGRAPLDFTTLRAGDESGFVIEVPVSSPVARYRVGFRSEDGRIIGHVDRRNESTIARGPS
jgi:hypothetical protein